MNLTVILLTVLATLMAIYICVLKIQVQGLVKSYEEYCNSFCSYNKICKGLHDYSKKGKIDILRVVEQALYFYANNLLRDIQGDPCKLQVVYDCIDGGEKSVNYLYNPQPAKDALELLHLITKTQAPDVIEDMRNKIYTGINYSLYNEILNTLIEIEKTAAYISSPNCKNRRREAKKILKLLQIIRNTREEII